MRLWFDAMARLAVDHTPAAVNVDDKLFKETRIARGATTDTETVRLGLEAWCATQFTSVFGLCAARSLARAVPRPRGWPLPKRRVA
jgi:hypothetical protein